MNLAFSWPRRPLPKSPRVALRSRVRGLTYERLERRDLLATLGLGIHLRADSNGSPGDLIEVAPSSGPFWVEVIAEDRAADRGLGSGENSPGVISMPLHISWNANFIQLVAPPPSDFTPNPISINDQILTPDLPLQRFLDAFDANAGHVTTGAAVDDNAVRTAFGTNGDNANLRGLRAASLPNANPAVGREIGSFANRNSVSPESPIGFFSQLRFEVIATPPAEVPFSMQVAGSLSFADADLLDGVDQLTDSNPATPEIVLLQDRGGRGPLVTDPTGPALAVTEFIRVQQPSVRSSLSGFVFADEDMDGVFDPVEIGLPNVELTLVRTDVVAANVQVTTGPGGAYLFDNLDNGIYEIRETQPPGFVDASVSVGTVPPDPVPRGVAPAGQFNLIQQIDLQNGGHGINYNFGENVIPTKRNFLSSSNSREMICESLGLECVTVRGGEQTNEIRVRNQGGVVEVTVDGGPPQEFSVAAVDIVTVDPIGSQVSVTIEGTPGDDTAVMTPQFTSVRRGTGFSPPDFGVLAVNAEDVTVDVSDPPEPNGTDVAIIFDSVGNDQLSGTVGNARLDYAVGIAQFAAAMGFDRVRAISTAGIDDDATTDAAIELVGNWV